MANVGMAPEEILTCTACRIRVPTSARRDHYSSDLHRVNLKRKVSGLGALSEAEFHARLTAMREESSTASERRVPKFCLICSKRFASERALQNHNLSRRHIDAARARASEDAITTLSEVSAEVAGDDNSGARREENEIRPDEDEFEEDSEPIPVTVCLFDGNESGTVEENLEYMARNFGFFLPYIEALRDVHSLLHYLGQKVGIGHTCVECDRTFSTLSAARMHMKDKQHCRMTDDDELWVEEFSEFYDFGGDDSEIEDEEGWEEVDDGEKEPAAEVGGRISEENSVVLISGPKPRLEMEPPAPGVEAVSLVVNGKVLGHRSLRRYYEQSYAAIDNRESVRINKVLGEYRLLGWKGDGSLTPQVRQVRVETMKRRKFDLSVGSSNYYTRKSKLRTKMAVFNSGYRP